MIKLVNIYKQILSERNYSNITNIANHVYSQLHQLQNKIIDFDLGSLEISDLLNDKFNKLNITFEISNDFGEHGFTDNYADVGIHYAAIDETGQVYIYLLDDIYNILDKYNYKQFCSVVKTIVIHELTHADQIEKSDGKFKSIDSTDSNVKYLSNIHEIQAHANQAMQEYLEMGYDKNEILKLLKNPEHSSCSPQESDAFWKYYDTFFGEYGDKVIWKKFLKYCYQYLEQDE